MVSKNVPVKIAQRFFGYADVSMTMVIIDAYSHVLRDMRTKVAQKIEEIFFWQGNITLASKGRDYSRPSRSDFPQTCAR
jgi:hypothetical protein